MESPQDTTGLRLDIDMGTPLFLELRGVPGKFKSKLIGMDVGRYLIITTPSTQLPPGTKVDPDTFIKVRYVHHGSVFGFDTLVRGIIIRPTRLLMLAYPKQVAEQSLRKAERFDCHILCDAVGKNFHVEGTLVDISMAGCRYVMPLTTHKDPAARPAVDDEVELQLHTHEAGEVKLAAKIINITEHHGVAQLGIRFENADAAATAALEKVILPFSME